MSGRVAYQITWAGVGAAVLLLLSGVGFRLLAQVPALAGFSSIELPIPLGEIPQGLGPWHGRDVPIPEITQKVAGNDDFLSRLYVNERAGLWASLYVAYTARPRTMLGHRPQICYPSAGWVHDGTERITLRTSFNRELPCLLHRFHRPTPDREDIVVLNFYVVNGQLTDDDNVFSGVGWRTPNIDGDIARYVAQIQVASALENSVRQAAKQLTERILDYVPNEHGVVRAAPVGGAKEAATTQRIDSACDIQAQ